jgi:hypothetical protein
VFLASSFCPRELRYLEVSREKNAGGMIVKKKKKITKSP